MRFHSGLLFVLLGLIVVTVGCAGAAPTPTATSRPAVVLPTLPVSTPVPGSLAARLPESVGKFRREATVVEGLYDYNNAAGLNIIVQISPLAGKSAQEFLDGVAKEAGGEATLEHDLADYPTPNLRISPRGNPASVGVHFSLEGSSVSIVSVPGATQPADGLAQFQEFARSLAAALRK
jgi:hypothetical protein